LLIPGISGQIEILFSVSLHIIELNLRIISLVADQLKPIVAYQMAVRGSESSMRRCRPVVVRIFQQWEQVAAGNTFIRYFQSCHLDHRGVYVHQRNRLKAMLSGRLGITRILNYEIHPGTIIPEGEFRNMDLFSQVIAMVAPKDHHCIIGV